MERDSKVTRQKSVLVLANLPTYQGKVERHLNPLADSVKNIKIICANAHDDADIEAAENITIVEAGYGNSLLNNVLELFIAFFVLLREDYDCIVSVSLYTRGIYGLVLGFIFRKPVHLRIIGADIPNHARAWYRDITLVLIQRFDSISVHGSAHRKFLIDKGVSKENIHILPGSIPIQDYERSTQNKPDYDFIWVGGMKSHKRPEIFLDALAVLDKRGIEFRAVMVGDGPVGSKVNDRIADLDLQERVDRPGMVDVDDVPAYLANSKIFALTSSREGFGFPLVEAMASGLTCIAPKFSEPALGNTDFIIEDGVNGILVSDMTQDKVADVMESALKDEELRQRLSENALESSERFSPEQMQDGWSNVVSSLCR